MHPLRVVSSVTSQSTAVTFSVSQGSRLGSMYVLVLCSTDHFPNKRVIMLYCPTNVFQTKLPVKLISFQSIQIE
jgi:hypothetical protein